MDLEIRRLRPGEEEAFIKSVRVPFLDPLSDGEERWMDRTVRNTEVDRSWVAETGGRFVANCGIHSLSVTLPGRPGETCPVIPMGGITRVGVHPTHRRRGILRQMMDEMLADCRARGEAIAGLLASEAGIYGRFGFGLATEIAEYEIDTREAGMLRAAPRLDLQLLEKEDAAKVLPDLFDRQRRVRAGEPSRNSIVWEDIIEDPPSRRHGANPSFVAACDEGYVVYRAKEEPSNWKRDRLIVEELRGFTPAAEAGMWQFLFDIDLIDQILALRRPVDESLRWRLADPRQLRQTVVDDRLHVRILDTAAALTARQYQAEGQLVLDVVTPPVDGGPDDEVPGRWVLEVGPDGASCRRARPGEDAELRLDVASLGSMYMGAFAASLLAAAGRVEELRSGTLKTADRLFVTWPAPVTGTGF
jgi:predicted acetyltransferase